MHLCCCFSWSVFSCIRTKIRRFTLRKSPYSVKIQKNTDHKNLRIWTIFTQRPFFYSDSFSDLFPSISVCVYAISNLLSVNWQRVFLEKLIFWPKSSFYKILAIISALEYSNLNFTTSTVFFPWYLSLSYNFYRIWHAGCVELPPITWN